MTDLYSSIPSFNKIMPKFLDTGNVFLVVGEMDDSNSIGSQVLENLKNKNIKAVSAKPDADFSQIAEKPNVCVITTSSDQTLPTLQKCKSAGINMIWIDMGSENQEAIDYCGQEGIEVVYQHSLIKELTAPTEKELEELGKAIS